jgi:NTP pyrophosphatase (non-canonical NTP hydrolase)
VNLQNLIGWAHQATIDKGFKAEGERRPVAEHVALITTEIGELYEAHRDGQKPGERWYDHGDGVINRESVMRKERDGVVIGTLGKPVGIDFELADIVIRVCDMAGEYGLDLNEAVLQKMRYNATRPPKHGRQS